MSKKTYTGDMPEEILFPEDIEWKEDAPAPDAGQKPVKKKKRSVFGRILLILLIILLTLAAAVFIVFRLKMDKLYPVPEQETFNKDDVSYNDEAEDYLKRINTRYKTILIYGVDARNSYDLLRNANADSEILVVIDNLTHEMKMVSLHRDMFTQRASGGYGKLTDIYAGYGVKESMDTLNRTLDLRVTDYVAVNWNALQQAVDLLGGLDLYLSAAEVDYINFRIEYTGPVIGQPVVYLPNNGDGMYHLNGTQVVCHCSNRSVGRDDISRAERQRNVISAMLSTAKTKDLKTLNTIVDTMLPNIATNITAGGMTQLLFSMFGLKQGESMMFPFNYIGQKDYSTSYVYCNTLTANVSELHRKLYGTEDYAPSSAVRGISDFIDGYRAEHP